MTYLTQDSLAPPETMTDEMGPKREYEINHRHTKRPSQALSSSLCLPNNVLSFGGLLAPLSADGPRSEVRRPGRKALAS
ncbi:hypothetical protein SAPIO_CDS9743 [Scedosporium apiospermum]|uniref:Uncharacterized protein n=1 Tax=Pseudallescheria apiosperma TaxID=563466 RepID=A0A084FXG5_PSEDA|nr:uncharacterized protein SAPIO_CDS9743 [Scedosporium apiospermum]KEZ39777.1 hypothetical protein SAPIO_CDS9743 [Scedosporium apiospermum]